MKRPAALSIHLAALLIIAGALISTFSARKGMLHLRSGEAVSSYEDDADGSTEMGFSLRLDSFDISYYPGTDTPSDYRSKVTVLDRDGRIVKSAEVSMNHILAYRGYRFCQSSYDEDEAGSGFTVSRDVAGTATVYTGYALFLLAFLAFFFTDRRFRSVAKKVAGTAAAVAVVVLLCGSGLDAAAAAKNTDGTCGDSASARKAPKTLPRESAANFGKLYVYYRGRVCPLQSVAHDFRLKLYGTGDLYQLSDEQVMTGWMFFPSSWKDVPQKSRRSADDAGGRQQAVSALLAGELLKIYPLADSTGRILWYSQNDVLPDDLPYDEWLFVRKSMNYIGELAAKRDYAALDAALEKIRKFQTLQAGRERLPSALRIGAERIYNTFPPMFPLAGVFLLAALGLLGFFVSDYTGRRSVSVRVSLAALVLVILLFAYMTLMLGLIWTSTGHVPLSNGAETMMSIAWTVLLAALPAGRHFPLMRPFALIVASLSLLVAAMGQANPALTLLVPVLSSPLLSIHVSLMMLSYAILAVIMVNSAAGLIVSGIARRRERTAARKSSERLADISSLLLYFGLFFLSAGIITGSVWANVSWGCYWNWDPKETWALITLLIYSAAAHRSIFSFLRKPDLYHIYLLLAFVSVLFTYFGVNFLLGGLHSYAG